MSSRVVIVPGVMDRIDYGPILNHIGDSIVEDAQRIAPVDTGDLRSTIRKLKASKKKVRVVAGGKRGAVTGNPVDYAGYVENGTSRMKAQPYLRPATYRYRAGGVL